MAKVIGYQAVTDGATAPLLCADCGAECNRETEPLDKMDLENFETASCALCGSVFYRAPSRSWDDAVHADRATELFVDAEYAWGDDAQIAKAAEECAELAAELNRAQNGQGSHEDLVQELIDVRIMLEQLTYWLDVDELERELADGLDDLDDRLAKHGADV